MWSTSRLAAAGVCERQRTQRADPDLAVAIDDFRQVLVGGPA